MSQATTTSMQVLLLDLLPPAMQVSYTTELPNRRSNLRLPADLDQSISLDEILTDLKLEVTRDHWPWNKRSAGPQQALGVQSQIQPLNLRPQWQQQSLPQTYTDVARSHGWAAPSSARPSADVDECWNCGGKGHRSFQCPSPRTDNPRGGGKGKGSGRPGGGGGYGGKGGGYKGGAGSRSGKGGWRQPSAPALHHASQALATFDWQVDSDGTWWYEDSRYEEWMEYMIGLHAPPDTALDQLDNTGQVSIQYQSTGLASFQNLDNADSNPWGPYARSHVGSFSIVKIGNPDVKPKRKFFDSNLHGLAACWTALFLGIEKTFHLFLSLFAFLMI